MAAPCQYAGHTFSHYRIIEPIGTGGMGVVYRAHDERLNRDVAVKVLPPNALSDEQTRKRLRKEALILSQLNHPNVASIYDFDTQDGIDFIVMELIDAAFLQLGRTNDRHLVGENSPEHKSFVPNTGCETGNFAKPLQMSLPATWQKNALFVQNSRSSVAEG